MFYAVIRRRSVITGKTRCLRYEQFETGAHADKYVLDMDDYYHGFIHTWQQVVLDVMTTVQAVAQLSNLEGGDPEDAHRAADYILCSVLRTAGPEYLAVVDAYYAARDRIGFLYA